MRVGGILGFALAAALAAVALAQQAVVPAATGGLTFEVATIKPTARTDGSWRLQPTPNGYTGMDVSLLSLIGEAYGLYVPKFIVGGPDWIDRDKFDLEAKFNAAEVSGGKNLDRSQRLGMLQALLADRFQLRFHREMRTFPVFELVLGKNGPKLHKTKSEDVFKGVGGASCYFLQRRPGHFKMQGCTAKDLEGELGSDTGRTVLDKTGLTDRYDFELSWTPEDAPPGATEFLGPSVFSAVQEQLGLKLRPANAPLSVLVIDSAQKPTAN